MNRNNNKDLYQILKIDKNANQQEINSLALTKNLKDNPEVDKALMVLSDSQKRAEYDLVGWKGEWDDEWRNRKGLCNSVFEAIHEEFKKTQEGSEGWRYHVMGRDLDPALWAPFNSNKSADANWIEKIYSIVGPNWRQNLEDFRDKMIAAIRKKYQENKQNNPSSLESNHKYEYKEKFNCGKCGKHVEMFPYCGGDGKRYCSFECLDEAVFKLLAPKEYKKADYICMKCLKQDKDVCEMGDGEYYHKSCFIEKKQEQNGKNEKENGYCVYCGKKNGSETWDWDNTKTGTLEKYCSYECREKAGTEYCDNCGKEIERIKEGKNTVSRGIFTVDQDGNHGKFCSEQCREKKSTWKFTVKRNPFAELLQWMEKAGITNISADQGKLILEFGKNQKQVIEDNDLTNEQKEIKNFLQSIGKNSLSQSEVKEEAKGKDKIGGEDRIGWVPMLGIGIIVLVIIALIGVIIYKNKKKGY